jgi:hypothetical protein
MESYIKVIGESKYLETVQKYLADINIIVWTNRTKIPLDEIILLRDRCIQALLSNGLKESELKEGGINVRESSLNPRRIRQEARQKMIVSCSDISRLIQAASTLDKLFKNPRYSFTLEIREPVFNASLDVKEQAKKEAIKNAYYHGKLLADSANIDIDNVVKIQAITPIIGELEDFSHELKEIVITAKSNNNINYKILENAVRQITLRYRVSFGIKSLPDTVRLNTTDFS